MERLPDEFLYQAEDDYRAFDINIDQYGGRKAYRILGLNLPIDDQKTVSCYYSILAQTGETVFHSSMGSFESNDGEFWPLLEKYVPIDILIKEGNVELSVIRGNIQSWIRDHNVDLFSYDFPEGNDVEYPDSCMIDIFTYVWLQWKTQPELRTNAQIVLDSINKSFSTMFNFEYKQTNNWRSFYQETPGYGVLINRNDVGLKMLPLTNLAMQSFLPAVFPWNEIYAYQKTNILRILGVCRNFPLYYGNEMLVDCNIHLYQNFGVVDRIKRTEEVYAKNIELQKKFATSDDPLQRELADVSDETQSMVLYSKNSMVIFVENWFRPIAHLKNVTKNLLASQITLFSLSYAFYTLSLNKIIHTDPHLYNIVYDNANGVGHIATEIAMKVGKEFDVIIPKDTKPATQLLFAEYVIPKVADDYKGAGPYSTRLWTEEVVVAPDQARSIYYDCVTDDTETITLTLPMLDYRVAVADFSRCIHFDDGPFKDSLQPYKYEMLGRRRQAIIALVNRVVNLKKFPNVTSNLTRYIENNIDMIHKCLECADLMLVSDNLAKSQWEHPWMKENATAIHKLCKESIVKRFTMLEKGMFTQIMEDVNQHLVILNRFFDCFGPTNFDKFDWNWIKTMPDRCSYMAIMKQCRSIDEVNPIIARRYSSLNLNQY